ncbi:gamma-glutamyltransferase [Pontibacillus yanchengensis]|uniref:Gamma-glutamyltransferase n=1 Tax=Pontibacillus yanchengensis TaxID=462910 RepID=A0ACC7VI55_9BACI|nr:gamma-glutamyltransferase [Pontibacillus yanchengensis]MYL54382.1 gamma-glutamyltransferase [Pontibacillus yanchengensis]
MLQFDSLYSPYHSKRTTTVANQGMVATSQPLAAQVGLDMMKKGGNAIDAAIAAAATLTVVEPTSNGIGGDAFALVWTKGKLHGLNGSGPAPQSISIDKVKAQGYDEMPTHGWVPVTVPGVPSAWAELSDRFGNLSFKDLLEPAIHYAEKGFPISPTLGKFWRATYEAFRQKLTNEAFTSWFETFAPNGRAPYVGEVWGSADMAQTLQSIANTKGVAFYKGDIADQIASFSEQYGGYLLKEDLANYSPEWVDPISIQYKGYDVWEIPPNGQGLIALQALNILKGYEITEKESVDTYHKQMEAMKLAFTDGKSYITEEMNMSVSVKRLLSEEYAEERRKLIGHNAITPEAGTPPKGGTVYLATADNEGNMVSFIQSNYMGFGSGLVVPGTGIALQNRGHSFSLNPHHDNALAGGKRTYHTIIPGFLTKGNEAVGPFGVMGGFMQPQGHLQVMMNTIDFNMNPQSALDAPRWQWLEKKKIIVEPTFPSHIAEALTRKGHHIQVELETGSFGRGQIIWRDPNTGTLYGGTESRTDGTIAAY